MLANRIEKRTGHYTESELIYNGKINSLINFLEINLIEFPSKINVTKNTKEPVLNQKLIRFLETKNSFFKFMPENLDETGKNKSKPDLGVYEKEYNETGIEVYVDDKIRFFDIECKRLNNPKIKEYVHGKTGGIQRFKENKHGVDLPQSAMIAYIETNDFDFWHEKINSWIDDKKEHLNVIKSNEISILESIHRRNNSENKTIKLTHFMLKIGFINI